MVNKLSSIIFVNIENNIKIVELCTDLPRFRSSSGVRSQILLRDGCQGWVLPQKFGAGREGHEQVYIKNMYKRKE